MITKTQNQWQFSTGISKFVICGLMLCYAMESRLLSAAVLSVTVPAKTAGYLGPTSFATATVSGAMNTAAYDGGPLVTIGVDGRGGLNICSSKTSSIIKNLEGVYGLDIKNPDGSSSGAVLVPDGTASWTRKLFGVSGATVTGTITYTKGKWVNNWTPAINGATKSQSNNDGTDAKGDIFCPTFTASWASSNFFDMTSTARRSSSNIRFYVFAPTGGLFPGKYSMPTRLSHVDYAAHPNGLLSETLADRVEVIVPQHSCTLAASNNSLTLTNDSPTASTNLQVQCQGDNSSAGTTAAWLTVRPSGNSAGITTGNSQLLGVKDSGGEVTIRGNWSSTAPAATCSDSNTSTTMYFDGRDGLNMGNILYNKSLDVTKPVSFRLCSTASAVAGNYTAQATFEVVQR